MGIDEINNNVSDVIHKEDNSQIMRSIKTEGTSANNLVELSKVTGDICSTITGAIRMEMAEMSAKVHPYFVAVQYHPEFLSRPTKPSPPFYGLIMMANKHLKDLNDKTPSRENIENRQES